MTDAKTARILGRYQRQLQEEDVDAEVIQTLVIEAARHEVNKNGLRA